MKSRTRQSKKMGKSRFFTKRRKMHGGRRLAGHVNPHIYDDEYQMVSQMIGRASAEQGGYPRYLKMREVFAYLTNSEEVLKNKALRRTIRNKINELYEDQKNYIDDDREFAEIAQALLARIDDLDTRNVRHQIPN